MTSDDVLTRCLGGGNISRQNVTATVVRAYVVSPFACFCEFHVARDQQDPSTRFVDLLVRWGRELERAYVSGLDPKAIEKQFSYDREGFKEFVNIAIAGEKYIYNPPLFYLPDNLAGKPDLLIRDDSAPSAFGNHHYCVTEIKFSSRFSETDKRRYLLQGVFYNALLGKVQQYTPPRFTMVDRHGAVEDFAYSNYSPELDQVINGIEGIRLGRIKPDPVYGTCGDAYWERYCNAKAAEARDISLVHNLGVRIRDQMVAKCIRTFDQLAGLSVAEIGKFKWVGQRGEFFSQQAKCLVSGREQVVQRVALPKGKLTEAYLDIEDTTFVHPQVPHYVFMIGTVTVKGDASEYRYFPADSEKDVAQMTVDLLGFLEGLGDYQIYYWSQKEATEFQKIFQTYKISGPSVDRFNARKLDLSEIIKGKVFFPVANYSVKGVGEFLGYQWEQEEVDAMEAVALYFEYLETHDKGTFSKIAVYNKDDCFAMTTIKNWLAANAT